MYEPKDKNYDLRILNEELVKDFYRLEYNENTIPVVEGFWRGKHWVIGKNIFCVPVIYVEWQGKNPPGDEYYGDAYWLPEEERDGTMYYGWDHGHIFDWMPTDFSSNRWRIPDKEEYAKYHHKYTIPEMMMEIAEWIEEYYPYGRPRECEEEDQE